MYRWSGIASTMILAMTISLAGGRICAAEAGEMKRLHKTLARFDTVRALSMRALMKAQDLKCIRLYGRGYGLDMAEAEAEDLLIEGLWLFEYLYAMDVTSIGLVSYSAADRHPHLAAELAAFRAFLPEAAAKVIAYYEKVARTYAQDLAAVKAAAQKRTPLKFAVLPAQAWTEAPIQKLAGDGFRLGWNWPVLAREGSVYARHLKQHHYDRERLLRMAVEAGIDYVRPDDPNVFDWPDLETAEGNYDWRKVDEILGLLRKYKLAIYLPIPVSQTTAPDWLVKKLGGSATIGEPRKMRPWETMFFMGVKNRREEYAPPNLFQPEVAKAFARYCGALVRHVKASGVPIVAVDLIGARTMAEYAGPEAVARWRMWLQKRYAGKPLPWGKNVTAATAELPKVELHKAADTAGKRMMVDVVRWRETEMVEYLRVGVEAVRKAVPEAPILAFWGGTAEFNEAMDGRNDERLIRELGLGAMGFTSGENIHDNLRRSLSPVHFSACTTHTGSGNAFAQYAFSSYMHDTLCLHTWPSPITRGFYWGDCYLYPDLRWRWSALNSWRRFHERAQGMAPEMLNARPVPQVAMLWSDTSLKFQAFIRDYVGGTYGFHPGAANYNRIGCIGWDRLLDGLCLPYNIISEDQIRQGELTGYKLLVMPAVQALPKAVADQVRTFVRNGGIAVATSAPALYGADLEQQGGGQLADVFGADFERFRGRSVVAETPMGTPRREGWIHPWWEPNRHKIQVNSDSQRTLFCSFKPRQNAKVLEKFTSGEAAVIMNTFGQGKAVAIGYPLGRESFLSDVYHQHYGHNWADLPYGPYFHQELLRWLELLLPKLGFQPRVVVAEEIVPRAIGRDAGWPSLLWPRKNGGYQDFVWKTGHTGHRGFAPRSVEVGLRARDGNPNQYLTLYNREGAYGYDPGVIHFESTSKQLRIELGRTGKLLVYDLSLDCPVPAKVERSRNNRRQVTAFQTMLEPSMGKMFVLSTDGTFRKYAGRRQRGRSDRELLAAVRPFAFGRKPPELVVIGQGNIIRFLAKRGPKGVVISCESRLFLEAAERLAARLGKDFRIAPRISRVSPRIQGQHGGINGCVENYKTIETPDIILGNRNDSHHLAKEEISYGLHLDHNPRLPIVTSRSFPGPGRAVIVLTRPYTRKHLGNIGEDKVKGGLFKQEPAPAQLVIGASDPAGMMLGVKTLEKLVKKAARQTRKR